jgi:hypothetical protein
MVYKMRKRWKILLSVSLILNILFVVGIVNFARFGKGHIGRLLSGNTYTLSILSRDGVKSWRKYNRNLGYRFKNDMRAQRGAFYDVRKLLSKGKIDEQQFRVKMDKIHELRQKNYQRFLQTFPTYWNGLTDKQRKKYMKRKKR